MRPRALAASYEDALALLGEQRFDIAIIDIEIEGSRDGIALGAELREEHEMPFVFVSSHFDRATITAAAVGQEFVSAPVIGGPKAAATGQVAVIVADTDTAVERAQPLLRKLGRAELRVGNMPGAANAAKLAANLLLLANLEALGEAMQLGERYGVERTALHEVLIGSAFDSPMMRIFGKVVASRRYDPAAFKLVLAQKDLELTAQAAARETLALGMLDYLRARLGAAVAAFGPDADVSAISESGAP